MTWLKKSIYKDSRITVGSLLGTAVGILIATYVKTGEPDLIYTLLFTVPTAYVISLIENLVRDSKTKQ